MDVEEELIALWTIMGKELRGRTNPVSFSRWVLQGEVEESEWSEEDMVQGGDDVIEKFVEMRERWEKGLIGGEWKATSTSLYTLCGISQAEPYVPFPLESEREEEEDGVI